MSTSQKMIECDVMEKHATLIEFLSIQNVVLYETFLSRALKIKFLNVIHICENNIFFQCSLSLMGKTQEAN